MTATDPTKRLYQGNPGTGARKITVEEEDGAVRMLEHHVLHSPDGHGWGYMGSGPSELAKDILWDYLGTEPRPAMYQDFKAMVIAEIPGNVPFEVTGELVQGFVETWERDHPYQMSR